MATSDSHANHTAHATAEAEPKTPMWLPAVGVFLFLVAGVYGVTTRTPEPGEAEAIAAAQGSATAAKPAVTAAPRPAVTNRPPTIPLPSSVTTLRLPQGGAAMQRRVP